MASQADIVGHAECKDSKDWVAAYRELDVAEAKCKRESECVLENVKISGLRREDAQNRVVWRRGIFGNPQMHACLEKEDPKMIMIGHITIK